MDMIEKVARAWASIDGKIDAFEREREGMGYDDPKYTGHYEGYMAEAKELLERSGLEGIQSYKTAALTVLAAVREYLPPDGISKDELISRVIEPVMTRISDEYNWSGDAEAATIYRADGLVMATVCKRNPSGEPADWRAIEIVRALNNLESLAKPGVTVKPLEWRDSRASHEAYTLFGGAYIITAYAGMAEPFKLEERGFGGSFSTYYRHLEDAKAAAQDDYERRILSAIET